MNAKRGSSVASSLDHLFATKVIKITDISTPTPHDYILAHPTQRYIRLPAMYRKRVVIWSQTTTYLRVKPLLVHTPNNYW
ncbi:hypothetical protein, partial [Porphyromonas sp.]